MITRLTTLLITGLCTLMYRGTDAQTRDLLIFPKENYTIENISVMTSSGEKKVTFHSYMHFPYASNPVDKDYQSLNESVPVKIDNMAVDAAHAPILLR